MWKVASLFGGVVVLLGSATIAASVVMAPASVERELTDLTADVNRGAYVARLAGCIACHTDAKSGGAA